jgi:hypothetical protein
VRTFVERLEGQLTPEPQAKPTTRKAKPSKVNKSKPRSKR